ncbi:disease resistance protein TAO1 [Brassica rapa]|uniref:disease resistance protein TAO1 n=1 Tax=Brassica campestris TaxID=3711 RepID=UPI00142E3BDE|nr:disease resistance protein TAO1 [Brassica rapa]
MMKTHSRLKWDIFLSFQRETSHSFTDRLYEALIKEHVRVWKCHVERKNQVLGPSLVEAIEDSVAFIVVLSPDYAKSHWCLKELAKLCDLRSSLGRPILPIFYEVDPWSFRTQGPFEMDFEEHSERFGEEEIQLWREAMKIVGNISGFVHRENSVDEDMIELVVKSVLAQVSNTPEKVGEYTVGLESRVEDLMNLVELKPSCDDVQILGLYGMGGIGKTTLAKAFYNKIIAEFEHRVFISNVRENSSDQDGLLNLQKSFIKALLRSVPEIEDANGGREKIRTSVHEKKILVVLDDVDNVDQVDALVGEKSWYGEGSLIIITTRDEEILSRLSVNQKYEVNCLTEMQALKLFSYHSLGKEEPTENLMELSKKIVKITGLLPLAIEVFGSHLYDKKEHEWLTELEKLKSTQPGDLQTVLALSFKSLDDEEKTVFLDIACLFLKMEIKKEEVIDVLKGCGFKAEAALNVLRQKSLVKFLADETIWMHDQIRDMGMQIDLKEHHGDLETRGRLWDRGEIMNVLNYKKGSSSIQGIVLDFKKKLARDPSAEDIALRTLHDKPGIRSVFSYLKNKFVKFPAEEKPKSSEITIPVEPFVPMKKLRLLQINHVELEGDLKLLPSELKWIQWRGCPLKDVPPIFLARKLAVLDLADSGIRRVQSLHRKEMDGNLKVVNLRGCHSLEAIPDLSNHKSLEKLILERCMLLVKVPRSVGNLSKLLQLDFSYCSNLTEFLVDVSGLKSLEKLFLSGCSNLSVLPENIGDMPCLKELLLGDTAIKNLPESISRLKKLVKLSLKGCRSIQELPLCIGMLASLEELNLTATALQNLPSSIGELKNLQKLYLMHCASLSKLPDTINELKSLKKLFINGSVVEELPLNPGSLPSLTDFSAGGCKHLKQVPSSIGGLNSLLDLELDWTPIETLPKEIGDLYFIRKLVLRNCKSLKVLPESIGDMDTLHSLFLEGSNIEKLPESFGKLENLVLLRMNNCKKIKRLPESFGDLKSLHHLFIQETLVVELPESFGNLSKLVTLKMLKKPLFRSCESDSTPSFVEVPSSFSNLLLLEELDARSWGICGKIPDVLGKLTSLKILKLGNNYFHSLPSSLEGLLNLRELSLYDCRELKCLPPVPCNLEQLNLANCFSLESISDLSKLKILHELNLTNCDKVDDIPGLEHLKALKRLYMSGCNSKCSYEVKKRLSKASLKMMVNLSLPGNRIPVWFSQGPLRYSTQPNRELRGVILAVVVALEQECKDDYQLPDVVEVQAKILKLDLALYTHTLHLSGVPRTSDDQLHICRYPAMHPMVTMFKDGYTIQVTKREPPVKQGVELKMHGIHLVYEGDDDFKGEESGFTETQFTVSQKLANFFSTVEENESSTECLA